MALRIRIEHGQDAGKVLRLGEPGTYRFGRSPHGSGQILDMKVSKEHFEILVQADGALLRDLGSSHGTLLNGQIVPKDPKPIQSGDEIRVGLTVMRAMSDGPADIEAKAVAPLPPAAGAAANGGGATRANGGSPAVQPNAGVGKPVAKPMPPDALVGTTLSGYRILEKVGAGGMGSVYRAEQLSLHREVALKVLADKLVSDSAFVDQFVNEARAAGQLNHPNVVQVYDVAQVDGRHFFSMEFIHGGSVEGKIPKTGGGVPWQDALNWFLDAANALIFAEQKGILHRDIKPDNFMVGQEGSVKLCDLGLAKKSESADLLAQGIIGTPHFIAPEAIRRKTDVDQRADLYSLGCTFYRVLTGKNPFPGTSVKEILLAHLNTPIPRVSALVSDLPKELDEIVVKLMAKDPAARFQNADDLWEALDKIRLQHGLEAHGFHPGRTKKIAIAIAAVAVAAIGTAIYFVMQPKGTETVTVINTVDNTDKGAPQREHEAKANAAFLKLKGDISDRLGKPDTGDAWKNRKDWDDAFAELRKFAKEGEYKDTPAAKDALGAAESLEGRWKAYHEKMQKLLGAIKAAEDAIEKASTDAVATANKKIGDKDWFGAMSDVSAGIQAVDTAGAAKVDGTTLVDAKRVEAARKSLENLAKVILDSARDDYDVFTKSVRIRLDTATTGEQSENLRALDTELKNWLESHPVPEGGSADELLILTANARTTVVAMRAEIATTLEAGQREGLVADRNVYFDLILALFTPLDELGQNGGAYAGMRLGEAAAKAKAAKAKTEPFKVLVLLRAHEADLVSKLPEFLITRFKDKGFTGKLTGRGWTAAPKEFKPDGVVVAGDKLHLYADEGPGFFLDIFFDKGVERYPLGADEHEALGALAEAAGIVEADGGRRFELALAEFAKAVAMEPARAARLAGRRALVDDEKAAKALLEEQGKKIDETNAAIDELIDQLGGSLNEPKRFEEIKKKIAALDPGWRDAVKLAMQNLLDVIAKHANTIVRALLAMTVPSDATYGVPIPGAPKAPPGPPADPPAPPPAAGGVVPNGPPRPNDVVPPAGNLPGMNPAPGGMDPTPPTKAPLPPGRDAPPPPAGMGGPK